MYKVLGLKENASRIQVFLDNGITFLLYKGEVRKYKINHGCILDDNLYHTIMELLYHRARERALYILDKGYKTEKQITDKLKLGLYPESIIESVIKYLKEYQLIDDYRYALLYIDFKSESKSKKQIIQDLYLKGISREIIDSAFEESNYSDIKSLEKLLDKKIAKYHLNEQKDVQKLYRYLLGKGYNYGDIREVFNKYSL